MVSRRVRFAVISASERVRVAAVKAVNESGRAEVVLELREAPVEPSDRAVKKLEETKPEIILADIEDQDAAVPMLRLLRSVLPDAWPLVYSPVSEPSLIIEAMRAGAREFLTDLLTDESLAKVLDRYLEESRLSFEDSPPGEVFLVTAAKGGAGATTVAINLACAVAKFQKGLGVSLIDLCSTIGDTPVYLDLKPRYTTADALSSVSRLDPVLLQSYMNSYADISVLAGVKEFTMSSAPDPASLQKLFEIIQQTYEYTFVDMPLFSSDEVFRFSYAASASVILVMTPDLPSIWRTERFLDFLDLSGFDRERIRLVVNRTGYSREIPKEEIEKAVHWDVFWSLPNDYRGTMEAINRGKALMSLDNSKLAQSFQRLAEQLVQSRPVEQPQKKKKQRRALFDLFSLLHT
jgi:pilus assembly protein CpaE